MGVAMMSTLARFMRPDGLLNAGSNRLFRIVITVHLVWQVRCQRVMEWDDERQPSEAE